ncbi:MAG: insulinase family protein [Verrucomicrobiota bacterium]|nr:insulinase family protein [Verrucomicrobiota bacterium]
MLNALDAVGQTYHGFLITQYLPLKELHSTLIELVHEPTGARVMHIVNEDPENLFCLSFQTFPSSSNGVAHILEHTVLCGSKKFPVKDPFFAMTRRSLNTFMNAFTGNDFTCYPASSQVEKDFYNLLDVYIDAVFYPSLRKLSFLQEGHRLELSDPSNLDSPLRLQGVVYNEMKGAMSSSESRLWKAIGKALTPDLPYAYNSGGDPKDIPTLSYEELVEFHQTYYNPSRCLFFFYGNLPLAKHLDFIRERVLENATKLPLLPPLPLQPRFSEPLHIVEHYPAAEKEEAQIAFSWLTAHLSSQSDVLALCLLENLLMETDASPLKMALLKSKLCKEADSSIDVEMSEVPWTIVCKGCKPTNQKKLEKLLLGTLAKIASKPIDTALVDAALHQLEFHRLEINGEGGPFGLTLFFRAGLIKQHGSEPESALLFHTLLTELRARLNDPDYLPSLMRRYLVDNRHFVSVTLLPDPDLAKKEQAEEQKRLEIFQTRLSHQDKEQIAAQSKELLKYQEEIEHQSLDCLPKVTLRDVPPRTRDFPLSHQEKKGFDLYHHTCFTNKILYVDWVFDLPHIEAKDLPLVGLLSRLWTELGCGGKSYDETLHFMHAHTGGIDASLSLHISSDNPDLLLPSFSLRGKALDRKAEPFFQLLYDFAQGPDFSDTARIREWLEQHATELQTRLVKNSLNYATGLSLSGYSDASWINNQWHGLPYYHFIQQLASSKKKDWMKRLKELAHLLVSNGKPHLVLACDKEQLEHLNAHHFYALDQWKPRTTATPWRGHYKHSPLPSQARLIPSPVAFTALGLRTSAYRDPDVAELMISTELFPNVILHKEIREKGGAYGGGTSYTPTTGNYTFYAHRDPHLTQTLATFRSAIEKLGEGHFNDRELEEAKLGLLAGFDTPVPPGGRAIVAYSWLRSGRTLQARQNLRDQILSATKQQITQAIQRRLSNAPSTTVSFLGKEIWDKEKPSLELKELLSE